MLVVLTKTDLLGHSKHTNGTCRVGGRFLSSPEGTKLLGTLAAEGLLTEPLGGPLQVAAVDAKGLLQALESGVCKDLLEEDRYGIHHLLESLALQAEVLGLQAKTEGPGRGVVLETRCSTAQGGSASLLLKEGTVK